MCINATVRGDMVDYELTMLRGEQVGWVAIGFGRKMNNTHMVIMWPNEDGTTTLSQRKAIGHVEPLPVADPPRVATLLTPKITAWHPANSTTFAFQVPANKTLLASAEPVERLIWAYAKSRPAKFSWSVLTEHYRAGFLRLNFTKDVPELDEVPQETPAQSQPVDIHVHHDDDTISSMTETVDRTGPYRSFEKIIVSHAILLSLGFLVILPAGSLIARWGRTYTQTWFKAHWISNMGIALPLITVGWILGPIAINDHDSSHLASTHQISGAFLVMIYYAQVFLGRYIHKRRARGLVPANKPHPPSNILHVVLGLTTIGLAFFQVHSGFDEWENATGRPPIFSWAHDVWLAWIVAIPLAYLSGLVLLSRQFHQEQQGEDIGAETYIALSDGSVSPTIHLLSTPEDDEDTEAYTKEFRGRN